MPPLDLIAWLWVGAWVFLLLLGLARMRTASWPRLASSFVLVVLVWYGYVLAEDLSAVRYAGFIAAGMSVGLVGDLYMARVLPAPSRELAGMLAFGLGHIFYITAVVTYAPVGWIAWIIWLLIGGLLGYFVVLSSTQLQPPAIRRGALGYTLLLASTAGVATGLALQQPLFSGLAVGAALFLVSDLLIALDLFANRKFPAMNTLIWLTYGPAQALIVTSIWSTFQP